MGKWLVFKERLDAQWNPMWAVWDDTGAEWLFRSGREALEFVNTELTKRYLSELISYRKAQL